LAGTARVIKVIMGNQQKITGLNVIYTAWRQRIPIHEVPVCFHPRAYYQGKKIRPRDALIALWTLFKFRWIKL